MSDVTVKQFAEVVGIPVDRLIAQLNDAGLATKASDETITDDEKMTLLSYLRGLLHAHAVDVVSLLRQLGQQLCLHLIKFHFA